MLHIVRIKHHADEIGATEYLYGPLPNQPIPDRVALGRRMLLASIESASLKIVLTSVAGNVDAPVLELGFTSRRDDLLNTPCR